jgi:hypothetical protein
MEKGIKILYYEASDELNILLGEPRLAFYVWIPPGLSSN